MPIPGYVLSSSDGFTGGQNQTRFAGPLISGNISDSKGQGGVGPIGKPGAMLLMQSSAAGSTGITNSLVSNALSTAAAAIARAAFIYIPQTTNPVATTSFASLESAPPYIGCGAALVWDAGRNRLTVWSTAGGAGTWFASAAYTSS